MQTDQKPNRGTPPPEETSASAAGDGDGREKSLSPARLALYRRVLHKLRYAKKATIVALEEIDHFFERIELAESISEYKDLWDKDINAFIRTNLSEAELHAVEESLDRIPLSVRTYYELMLREDPPPPAPEKPVKKGAASPPDAAAKNKAYKIIDDIYRHDPDPLGKIPPS